MLDQKAVDSAAAPPRDRLEELIQNGDFWFWSPEYAEADQYYRRALRAIDRILELEDSLEESDVEFTDRLRKKRQIVTAKAEIALLGKKLVDRRRAP